jgi:hypothetical protein
VQREQQQSAVSGVVDDILVFQIYITLTDLLSKNTMLLSIRVEYKIIASSTPKDVLLCSNIGNLLLILIKGVVICWWFSKGGNLTPIFIMVAII